MAGSGNAVVIEAVNHGIHDLYFLIRGKGDKRRAGSADSSSQGTGFDSLLKDLIAAGDEADAVRHVQFILQAVGNAVILFRKQRRYEEADAADVEDSALIVDGLGQGLAGFFRRNFDFRTDCDKTGHCRWEWNWSRSCHRP